MGDYNGDTKPDVVAVQNPAPSGSFGDIRKFELWVDGNKISEQHHNWGNYAYFDLSTTLSAGTHKCTLNITTVDNDAEDYNFTLQVP